MADDALPALRCSDLHTARMKSRVHPKYKTKYRVTNWPEYEESLIQRGDTPSATIKVSGTS